MKYFIESALLLSYVTLICSLLSALGCDVNNSYTNACAMALTALMSWQCYDEYHDPSENHQHTVEYYSDESYRYRNKVFTLTITSLVLAVILICPYIIHACGIAVLLAVHLNVSFISREMDRTHAAERRKKVSNSRRPSCWL